MGRMEGYQGLDTALARETRFLFLLNPAETASDMPFRGWGARNTAANLQPPHGDADDVTRG